MKPCVGVVTSVLQTEACLTPEVMSPDELSVSRRELEHDLLGEVLRVSGRGAVDCYP